MIQTARNGGSLLLDWERRDERDVSPNQIRPDIGALRRLLNLAPRHPESLTLTLLLHNYVALVCRDRPVFMCAEADAT